MTTTYASGDMLEVESFGRIERFIPQDLASDICDHHSTSLHLFRDETNCLTDKLIDGVDLFDWLGYCFEVEESF